MTAVELLFYISVALLFQLAVGIGVAIWRWRRRAAVPAMPTSEPDTADRSPAWPGLREFRVLRRQFEDALRTQCSFHLQNCVSCHSEHQGSRIGQGTRMAFSHALLQPATQAHCATCHTAPATALHRGLTTGCAQCHSTVRWTLATFDHARLFVLDRDHNAPCATCHVNNDTSRYTCYGCHEHQPDRIGARHRREGIRDFQNCVSCHRSAHGEPEGRGGRDRREERGGRERD